MEKVEQSRFVKSAFGYMSFFRIFFPLTFLIVYSLNTISYFNEYSAGDKKPAIVQLDYFISITPGMYGTINNLPLSSGEAFFLIIFSLITFTLIYFAILKLHALFRNVINGEPFLEKNGKNLKYIGITLMLLDFLFALKPMIIFPFPPPSTQTINSLLVLMRVLVIAFDPLFVAGIVICAFGNVMHAGYKIQEENNLTV